jgi:N utilization substance protein A
MRTEFQAAIAQLIHEKGLPQDIVMEAVANALLAAYRKSVGGGENVRIEVDRNGEVHVWATKRVVAQVQNPSEEISLGEAQQVDEHAALGQHMEVDSPQIRHRRPSKSFSSAFARPSRTTCSSPTRTGWTIWCWAR